MDTFQLFATPWWVNSAVLVPVALFGMWRARGGLEIGRKTLAWAALFAVAFGFIEAAVVMYLRAVIGLLPGYEGTLADVRRLAVDYWRVAEIPLQMPISLAVVEIAREAATMVALIAMAYVAGKRVRERIALFFWMAAIWDIMYYVWLRLLIGWPISLFSPDVLFLMPVPWISQVWFPILVSALTMVAVVVSRKVTNVRI